MYDLPNEEVDHIDTLQDLRRVVEGCRKCGLRQGCRGAVFGEGNPHSRLMFVGEAPGAVEDELGRPFVGRAGQLLTKIIAAMGYKRDEVYITNINKCRPPNNRTPVQEEVVACYPYLRAQLRIISPRVIVCLGAHASKALIKPDFKITQQRGQWYQLEGIRLMPTFHPAALLRNPHLKRPVWQDMQEVMAQLKTA